MGKILFGLIGIGVGYGIAYAIASNKGQANAVNPLTPAMPTMPGSGLLPQLPPAPYGNGPSNVTPVTANTVRGTQFGVRPGML